MRTTSAGRSVAQRVEVGLPAGGGVERQRHGARPGQGDGGQVVRIARVGQRDGLARSAQASTASMIAVFVPGTTATSWSGSSSTPWSAR